LTIKPLFPYSKVRNGIGSKEIMKATVTSKGQVTIPHSIRRIAKISPGTELDFQLEEDGTLKISLLNQEISQLKGIIKSKRSRPPSLKEMKRAIRKGYSGSDR
jgi:AbrB family looped-hinge helix DNA binding protein